MIHLEPQKGPQMLQKDPKRPESALETVKETQRSQKTQRPQNGPRGYELAQEVMQGQRSRKGSRGHKRTPDADSFEYFSILKLWYLSFISIES